MALELNNTDEDYQYVFIIGAAKCGTTALADLLDQHSNICLSYPKEPDFFTTRIYSNGFNWYENCFKDKKCKIRIDASVSYTAGWGGSSKEIAKRIYDFYPNAKIIYIMRDPIERTWSSYWHSIRNGKPQADFDSCIRDQSSSHITGSMYTHRIEDYLTYFPSENILLLAQNELKSSSDSVLNKVASHIEVTDLNKIVVNKERKVNSSYQFNWFGDLLLKVVPLKFVKNLAYFANRKLPSFISKYIKKLMSKPVPEMNAEQALYLKDIYRDELDKLQNDYKINLKTTKWWN